MLFAWSFAFFPRFPPTLVDEPPIAAWRHENQVRRLPDADPDRGGARPTRARKASNGFDGRRRGAIRRQRVRDPAGRHPQAAVEAQEKPGAPAPKGMPAGKAEWVQPGLVARVRFLKGEEKLRHATVRDVREGVRRDAPLANEHRRTPVQHFALPPVLSAWKRY
jgi:hypothetical protein